jgi:dTDP-4-dehydrorhamnose reductase
VWNGFGWLSISTMAEFVGMGDEISCCEKAVVNPLYSYYLAQQINHAASTDRCKSVTSAQNEAAVLSCSMKPTNVTASSFHKASV